MGGGDEGLSAKSPYRASANDKSCQDRNAGLVGPRFRNGNREESEIRYRAKTKNEPHYGFSGSHRGDHSKSLMGWRN